MTLKRSYMLGLILSASFAYACESTDDPGLADASSPVGGTLSGTGGTTAGTTLGGTTAGTTLGGTTAGTTLGGTTAGTTLGGTTAGTTPGGTTAGTTPGGTTSGTRPDGGVPGGTGDAGVPGGGDSGPGVVTGGSCPGLPAVTDFVAKGPFDSKMFEGVGPDKTYVMYRPDTTLGKNGLKHPVVVWGNGILTEATWYQQLLGHIASHGFVIIACPSSSPERPCLNDGMEWLIKQNTAEGPLKDKLDISKEATIGYSWGGGASIDTANRPNVKATVSFHGMPPREADPWGMMKAPLLLFSSIGDTFVSADQFVTPNYTSSKVTTFYSILQEDVGHLYIADEGSPAAAVEDILGGPCKGAIKEQAPAVAWLRHQVCGDNSPEVKKYFYGADCTLCKSPWKSQSKPMGAFN